MLQQIALDGAILVGAAMQRVTGMGFALVAAPLLVLVLGVVQGVPLVQVLSLCVSGLVLASAFTYVDWLKAGLLIVPGLIGIVPGWWISKHVPTAPLSILIGVIVIVALLAMMADHRARIFKGTAGALSAGFLSGFMNVTAGVGGPAIVLYSVSTRWRHAEFVATAQAYFVALNIASLIAQGWPRLDGATWLLSIASLAAGLALGEVLARRVPTKVANVLVIGLALAGSAATIVRGWMTLH
ncbi:MAG: TSUP family transporter [Propionibacteriaceae bacterium]